MHLVNIADAREAACSSEVLAWAGPEFSLKAGVAGSHAVVAGRSLSRLNIDP